MRFSRPKDLDAAGRSRADAAADLQFDRQFPACSNQD